MKVNRLNFTMSYNINTKISNKTSNEKVEGGDNTNTNAVTQVGEAVRAQPLEVRIYNGNFDRALKAFRALVQKERILSVYKERQSYEKPSQKKRRKKNEMKRKFIESQTYSSYKGKFDE